MTNTFTKVDKARFDNEMADMGFDVRIIKGVKETVFARDIPSTDFAVVIFSTFENGVMRSVGSDAIKVVLWNNVSDRPVASERRVNRVGDELKIIKRVRHNARECWAGAKDVEKCGKCDTGIMVVRKPKKGKTFRPFKGCSNFPVCKNSRSIS